MHPAPIKASAGPGAWLINESDVYRFDDIDDPRDEMMQHIYALGGIILFWDGDSTTVCFDTQHCGARGLSVARQHGLYPLTLVDVKERFPRRTARTRDEAEAICADLLMYRSLAVVDRTVVIDRPASQIATSSTLLKSTVEAWRGNADYDLNQLIEVVQEAGHFMIGIVGNRSLAALTLGREWAQSMCWTPALPTKPNQYEKAVFDGYSAAIMRQEPVLQDVHAKLETGTNIRHESYRRLVIPVSADQGKGFLLVASEILDQFTTSHGFAE